MALLPAITDGGLRAIDLEMSKYKAKKTIINKIKFESKKEANRYRELLSLLEEGKISSLELQPKFVLLPSFIRDGKKYRAITYTADFKYQKGGKTVVEDVKGYKTELYRLKKKWFIYKYPKIKFLEI